MFDAAKDFCDVLIRHQVIDEGSADFGAISCPGCRKVHVRVGEAFFPFCYFYSETGEKKYIESAMRLMRWLSRAQQADGSWGHEAASAPKPATVFITTALCHARQLIADELAAADRGKLEKMIARGVEYVYRAATLEWAEGGGPGINCFASSCVALQLASAVTGERRYAERAKDNALLATEQINDDGFLVGERPAGTREGLPSVDVASNLETGLGALVVYWSLTGDLQVRDAVLRALRTHLNFVTPSGYIDGSWGTRMPQWTLLGNNEGGGCQALFLPLRNFDARFQRAAAQNLRYMMKNMMKDGLVTAGPHAKDNPEFVPCIEPTAARANSVCQALVYCRGVPLSQSGKSILPTEEEGWVRFYRSVNLLQVRTSSLLCTITGSGHSVVGFGPGFPTGGTISHLWHSRFGTVQAASSAGRGGVQSPCMVNAPLTGCLTPRIEALIDGKLFSNLFEPDAVLTLSSESIVNDRIEVSVRGRLKSGDGRDSGLAYTIMYNFDGGRLSKEIAVEGVPDAKLRSVEPIVFAKGCELTRRDSGVEVVHPGGGSCLLTASPGHARIQDATHSDLVWNAFPALYALPVAIEPAFAATARRLLYSIELRG